MLSQHLRVQQIFYTHPKIIEENFEIIKSLSRSHVYGVSEEALHGRRVRCERGRHTLAARQRWYVPHAQWLSLRTNDKTVTELATQLPLEYYNKFTFEKTDTKYKLW